LIDPYASREEIDALVERLKTTVKLRETARERLDEARSRRHSTDRFEKD
jgi:hypothetical protein